MGLYMPCHACGTEGKNCRFPLSIIYLLELQCKSSELLAGTCTVLSIWMDPNFHILRICKRKQMYNKVRLKIIHKLLNKVKKDNLKLVVKINLFHYLMMQMSNLRKCQPQNYWMHAEDISISFLIFE